MRRISYFNMIYIYDDEMIHGLIICEGFIKGLTIIFLPKGLFLLKGRKSELAPKISGFLRNALYNIHYERINHKNFSVIVMYFIST